MLAQQKEVLMDEEIPILEADKQGEYVNGHMGMSSTPCHMEYQVIYFYDTNIANLGKVCIFKTLLIITPIIFKSKMANV